MDIRKLSLTELEKLKIDVEDRIDSLQRSERLEKKHTKEEIIAMFSCYGYDVPKGTKIWKLTDLEHEGGYGMEVGSYVHSCHIETTNFKVLLVVDDDFHGVESYSDLWLTDCIIA